jgi:Domain of unknown function (DUF4184)
VSVGCHTLKRAVVMPLTPAHTATAWPLIRLFPSLPLDALVIGTMAPDFQYLFELAPRGRFGHSPLGLLGFCLPVGLVTWAIYRRAVRPAGLTLLPAGLKARLVGGHTSLVAVAGAILLGAASHTAWDSFTHRRGWGVLNIQGLSSTVPLAGLGDVPVFKMLQHGSTILGIAAVGIWFWRWFRRQPSSARGYTGHSRVRAMRILAMLLGAGVAGALLNGLRGYPRGIAVGLGHAAVGAMAALAVALLIFGLMARRSEDPGTAT